MRGKKNKAQDEWEHPGGKLRDEGAKVLSNAELLAILISSGVRGKSAEKIAREILDRFGSLEGLASQPLKKFLEIKGLGDVKTLRIAAALEIARRLVKIALKDYEATRTSKK